MIPKQIHWRILRIIAAVTTEGSGEGLTCSAVAGFIGESESVTRHLLRELVSQELDEFGLLWRPLRRTRTSKSGQPTHGRTRH
jgi:hypothetical protein